MSTSTLAAAPPTGGATLTEIGRRSGRIELSNLTKVFETAAGYMTALSRVDLTIHEGEFLCLVGPSGCGKTTLLRVLAGLEMQSTGTMHCNISANGGSLRSMVFQGNGVFPWMTVLDNAAYGLAARKVGRSERNAIAREYLDKLGLLAFENAYPRELSGGMLQRVNLARAFANDPAILLMDEPFGALDEQTKMLAYEDLLALWEGSRKTVVFITHNLDEAIILGDRVAVMGKRPGRIKDIIDVRLPRPRNVLDMQNDREFIEVRRRIWNSLREEVISLRSELKAKGENHE
ncbi:ABC transporter ATP-binding protein [Cupriavidus sp. amp6]|uniref:ABC transporter ATP-binding protein n=1 Tax=Cupriavidus sp. amp6 TaxID=388051 RepID=UPI000407495D|nr:ABC transporter ATP-binding protein [Cupriavidus sp. amp6]